MINNINYFKYWSHLSLTFYAFGNAEMELFRQLLEKWHAAEYAHPSQNPYSVHKPVYQASLLSITESLVIPTRMPLSGISTRDHMMLKHIF